MLQTLMVLRNLAPMTKQAISSSRASSQVRLQLLSKRWLLQLSLLLLAPLLLSERSESYSTLKSLSRASKKVERKGGELKYHSWVDETHIQYHKLRNHILKLGLFC